MKFKINKEVFEKFPEFVVYIPIIKGFDNSKTEAHEKFSLDFQKKQQEYLRSKIADIDDLKAHPFITTYFDCFKKFGIDPTKSMPTHFALAKRVISGKDLPNINPMVNIYNSVSIKYLTPFGGEDLNTVYGDFELVIANGDEHWKGIGDTEPKSPPKGNLIWQDDYDVSTVSLNWRQCDRTKLDENSKNGYFIMDGFKGINDENIKTASEEFIKIVTENFGGKAELLILDIENPEAEISFESKRMEGIVKPICLCSKVPETKEVNKYHVDKPNKNDNNNDTKSKAQVKQTKTENLYDYANDSIEHKIQTVIFNELNKIAEVIKLENISVERTTDKSKGDYTSTFAMKTCSKFNMKPMEIGEEIVSELQKLNTPKLSEIEKIEIIFPGFVNFYLKNNAFKQVINVDTSKFGTHEVGKGKTVMIEYGQPNTHKSMTLGHVKSGISGQCIANLYDVLGYDVIKANYYSDIGLHVPKCMVGLFKKYCESLEFNEKNINTVLEKLAEVYENEGVIVVANILGKAYPEGHALYKSDENIKEIIDNVNKQIFDKSDSMITNFYNITRGYSVEYQDLFYSKIGINFDRQYPESEVFQAGGEIVKKYIGKIFIEDYDAVVFPGEKYGLSRWVFMNKKGIATYSGKDLGLAYLKFQEYPNLDFGIVLTSVEQIAYFKAVIQALELIDEKFVGRYKHIGFGWLLYGGKKLSSKTWKGSAVDDVFDELTTHAKKLISESKNYSEEKVEEISRNVAIASLKFAILSHEFHKDVNYDPEKFTSMSGFSAPYIMYSYARAFSILKTNNFDSSMKFDGDWDNVLTEKEEVELCKLLVKFPEVTLSAGLTITPHRICTYMYEVANAFSSFYLKCKVTNEKDVDVKNARLLLVNLSAEVIKKCLDIIGIEAVEKM